MGIEKIKSNNVEGFSGQYFLGSHAPQKKVYLGIPKDSTSFTGAAAAPKTIKDVLLDIMPKVAKRMVKIHEGMGEIQNQFINALGTGLVAPLFIKYNPLSDTDKDTRTYTAWRQPVSAILAVATQCAIVIPFNAAIKRMADIGYTHMPLQYNSSLFPSDDYIKKLIKADNPNKKFTKDEMKLEIESYKKKNNKVLEDMIKKDKIVYNQTDIKSVSEIEMPKEDFKKLFAETLDKIIESENIARQNTVGVKLPQKIERNLFYYNYPEESRALLKKLDETTNTIYSSKNKPVSMKTKNKEFRKACTNIIKELKQEVKKGNSTKEISDGLIKIVKEIKDKCNKIDDPSVGRNISIKISKMSDTVTLMGTKKSTKEIIEYVNEVIYGRTSAIDGTIETLKKIKTKLLGPGISVSKAQAIIDETIAASKNKTAAKMDACGIDSKEAARKSIETLESVGSRLEEKAGSIAKKIGEQLKKHAKSNIDGLKRWTGLGVSLAILPLTCWMLNRIYPWFMDLAFPKLSNKAASQKEAKKKVEV